MNNLSQTSSSSLVPSSLATSSVAVAAGSKALGAKIRWESCLLRVRFTVYSESLLTVDRSKYTTLSLTVRANVEIASFLHR